MTHKLAVLLNQAEDKFNEELERLESATGYQSHDVKFLSQNHQECKSRITDLNLDPDDTTAEELYHALKVRYLNDARQFAEDNNLENDERSQIKLAEIASNTLADQPVWTLKNAAIKALLTKLPPLKTRKQLGYRSLDSLLKRADLAFVVALAKQLESGTWQAKWSKQVKSLPASQHQSGQLRIILSRDHGLEQTIAAAEAGAIVVPLKDDFDPIGGIGQVLQIMVAASQILHKDLANELAQMHPALVWWSQNLHLTNWADEQPVSFNIYDVSADVASNANFQDRAYHHAGNHIWDKLTQGYKELAEDLRPSGILQSEKLEALPATIAAEVENV